MLLLLLHVKPGHDHMKEFHRLLILLLHILLLQFQVKPGHDHVKEFHMHVYWLQNNPQQVSHRHRWEREAMFLFRLRRPGL